MQQRRTSSRWMACRRYFLSNPRPISGIARKGSVTSLSIKLEARSAVHRCFRAYQIDVDTDLFGVWLVEMSYGRIGGLGRSKIRSFADRRRSGTSACLLTKACDRATSDWGRLPRARSCPTRAVVPAGPCGSSRRMVSRGGRRHFLAWRRFKSGACNHRQLTQLMVAC
jgi:predicted DNA-binding WGR domain protein